MENTRVYFDMEVENGRVRASVKNISKQQMNVNIIFRRFLLYLQPF